MDEALDKHLEVGPCLILYSAMTDGLQSFLSKILMPDHVQPLDQRRPLMLSVPCRTRCECDLCAYSIKALAFIYFRVCVRSQEIIALIQAHSGVSQEGLHEEAGVEEDDVDVEEEVIHHSEGDEMKDGDAGVSERS